MKYKFLTISFVITEISYSVAELGFFNKSNTRFGILQAAKGLWLFSICRVRAITPVKFERKALKADGTVQSAVEYFTTSKSKENDVNWSI